MSHFTQMRMGCEYEYRLGCLIESVTSADILQAGDQVGNGRVHEGEETALGVMEIAECRPQESFDDTQCAEGLFRESRNDQ